MKHVVNVLERHVPSCLVLVGEPVGRKLEPVLVVLGRKHAVYAVGQVSCIWGDGRWRVAVVVGVLLVIRVIFSQNARSRQVLIALREVVDTIKTEIASVGLINKDAVSTGTGALAPLKDKVSFVILSDGSRNLLADASPREPRHLSIRPDPWHDLGYSKPSYLQAFVQMVEDLHSRTSLGSQRSRMDWGTLSWR